MIDFFELREGKDKYPMASKWMQGAKSVKGQGFEFVRGRDGVHTIKKNGKSIGDFSLEDDSDLWVINLNGVRGQVTADEIDDIPKLISNKIKESVELDENQTKAHLRAKSKLLGGASMMDLERAGNNIKAYAKKSGGIDKKDFETAADYVIALGRLTDANKAGKVLQDLQLHVGLQDTDVRDKIVSMLPAGLKKKVHESVELEETLEESKIFFVKVGDGRDHMVVKVKADTKGAAVKKMKAQYPKKPVSLDRNQKQGQPAGAFESVEESVKTEDKGQFIYAAKQAKAKGDSTFVFAGKTYNCEEVLGENSKKATIQYVVVVKKTDRIVGVGATEKKALDSATIGSAHSGTQFNPAFEVPRDVVVRKLPKKVPSSGVLGQNYSRFVKNINKSPGAHARAQADILAK